MSVALVKIQIRNDTAQAWAAANPFLSDGEPGAESNTGRLKIGNGVDRWLDLPYVGGDGSGGGGGSVNPISGTIDGGIFTGNPRTSEATSPFQPAASKVYVDGAEALVVSWGPSYVTDPTSVSITYYAVEYTLTPSDETSWVYGGQSNVTGDTVENYAQVVAPRPIDPSNEYYYRVKAVLSNGGNGEWGYSPAYRHFKSVEPISFSLAATRTNVGSTGDDNSTAISVENLTGGGPSLQGPERTYPEITGINYIEDGETLSLENTNGTNTVNQSLFIQCMYTTSDSASEVQTIQINISDTSVDPGPGPGPGPTPGDTLPLFNWDLVENSTDEPPPPQNRVFGGTYRTRRPCGGNNCIAQYPCASGTGCNECEVDFVTVQDFTDFTLLWSSPNWSEASAGGIPTPVAQYKKRLIGGTTCTNDPIILTDGSELQLPNPMINVWNEVDTDPQGGLVSTTYYGRYETIDRLSINGSTASYAILYPKQNYNIQTGGAFGLGVTGTVIVTRDGGQTWQFVDILGNGFRYYHPNGEGGDMEPQANAAGMPKAFARSKSITNGREVLVAQFDRVTGGNPITQWYYTDDHIKWYPTTNADRLPDSANGIWYDAFTNTTYGTDPENTGVITAEGGTCSYWKSGEGIQPRPPEEPTFNWTLVLGSSSDAPGKIPYFERAFQNEHGRPPFYNNFLGAIAQPPFENLQGAWNYKLSVLGTGGDDSRSLDYWGDGIKGVYKGGDIPPAGEAGDPSYEWDGTWDGAINSTPCEFGNPQIPQDPPLPTPPTIRPDGSGSTRCPPNSCGVQVAATIRFNQFSLIFSFKNGLGSWPEGHPYNDWYGCAQGDSVTGDPLPVKWTRENVQIGTLDELCNSSNAQLRVPTGNFGETQLVDLALMNPFISECQSANWNAAWDLSDADELERPTNDTTGLPQYYCWQKVGGYQVLDEVQLGNASASYLLLRPRKVDWEALDGSTYEEQITGIFIVTRDNGVTWDYVNVFMNDEGQREVNQPVDPISAGDDWTLFAKTVQLPKMVARVWSHYLNRYVLVALMEKVVSWQGGTGVDNEVIKTSMFYYTDDHVRWYPCSREDAAFWGHPDNTNGNNQYSNQPTEMWTDPDTGNTYMTDRINTGVVANEEGGTCSYWISEKP